MGCFDATPKTYHTTFSHSDTIRAELNLFWESELFCPTLTYALAERKPFEEPI